MIKLEDKVRVLTPDATWIFGNLKDDTGTNDGTALNRLYHSDYANFFEKIFADSGIVANGLLDNEDNGYQLVDALRTVIANNDTVALTDAGDWVDDGNPTLNSLFGTTVTLGTVNYNRYKIIGKTLFWQLSFAFTQTGSPTQILVDYPTIMDSGNYDLANTEHVQLGVYGTTFVLQAINGGLAGAGSRQLGLTLSGGGGFANGTLNLSIVTELLYIP